MCEHVCANCTKFRKDPKGMPENIKDISRNVFFNEDGSEKELNSLSLLFGLQTSGLVAYGHRGCETAPSATIASSPCLHPESFDAFDAKDKV